MTDMEGDMTLWNIQLGAGERTIEAVDQHAAWNTLRNEPLESFGLIVTAKREGQSEDERIGVHTAALLLTWGRDEEARWLLDALAAAGVESRDTDLAYAFEHGRTAPFLAFA